MTVVAPEPAPEGRNWPLVAVVAAAGAVVALVLVGIVLAVLGGADRDDSGRIVEAGDLSVFDVRPGDCPSDIAGEDETTSVEAVPCTQPHDAEAYARFEIAAESWPGEQQVVDEAREGCDRRFPPAAADAGAEVYYWHPTEESWETRDDRGVVCAAILSGRRSGRLI